MKKRVCRDFRHTLLGDLADPGYADIIEVDDGNCTTDQDDGIQETHCPEKNLDGFIVFILG